MYEGIVGLNIDALDFSEPKFKYSLVTKIKWGKTNLEPLVIQVTLSFKLKNTMSCRQKYPHFYIGGLQAA